MNDAELYIAVGYLANPDRTTLIEVELPQNARNRFEEKYARLTGDYPLPETDNTAPYYVWDDNVNKWGIEIRLYFNSNERMPEILEANLEPRGTQNRPGYDNWQRRISTSELIYKLIECGFVLGSQQDEERIRNLVPEEYLGVFEEGYNL